MEQALTNLTSTPASSPTYRLPDGLSARLELVTPARAEQLLAGNTHNRPVSKAYVRELRRELEEGRWKPTHQGVAVADDGSLLDGQHRLMAIRDSGIPAPLFVAEGVQRDAWDAIDQHRRRTGGQILALAGVSKDAPRMVAMARAILQVVYGNNKVSNTAAAEYAVRHQTELELFLPVARQYTPAVAAAFAWCATLGWHETINAAERLMSTIWQDPAEFDPMRALHNRARNFSDLGAGQSGIKARFDIALNCLEACHEQRGLKVAKSYRPDYGRLERDSAAPHAAVAPQSERIPRPGRLPKVYDAEAHAAAVREYEEREERLAAEAAQAEFDRASLASTGDPELDEAVQQEMKKTRRGRQSAEG